MTKVQHMDKSSKYDNTKLQEMDDDIFPWEALKKRESQRNLPTLCNEISH